MEDSAENKILSLGEKRIGIEFKEGNNDKVQNLKEKFARLINEVEATGNENETSQEQGRLKSLAYTAIEQASMWAVKSMFS